MTNRIDIQEFINNAPENIVGSLNCPEAVTADMLDNIPHRYSSNLVVQYWLQVEKEDTVMRLLIDNKVAKYLGCTEEYLYYHACKNIGTPVVKNIIDMMSSMVTIGTGFNDDDILLYIITNASMIFGAFYLCMPDVIGKIADDYDSDLIIIPSSKHELLFIKKNQLSISISDVKQMVYTVNRTALEPKDILSDNVYVWDREKKKLIVY